MLPIRSIQELVVPAKAPYGEPIDWVADEPRMLSLTNFRHQKAVHWTTAAQPIEAIV